MGNSATAPWVNVLHVKYTGSAPNTSTLETIAGNVATNWETNMAPQISTNATLSQVDLVDLTDPSGAYGSVTTNHPGTRVGAMMPVNVAAVVSWKVNYRWRGGHPRTYFPAGVQADVVQGRLWTGAFISGLDASATSFHAGLNSMASGGNTFTHVVVRYIDQKVLLQDPLVLAVADVLVHDRVDSQRRRLGKESA